MKRTITIAITASKRSDAIAGTLDLPQFETRTGARALRELAEVIR